MSNTTTTTAAYLQKPDPNASLIVTLDNGLSGELKKSVDLYLDARFVALHSGTIAKALLDQKKRDVDEEEKEKEEEDAECDVNNDESKEKLDDDDDKNSSTSSAEWSDLAHTSPPPPPSSTTTSPPAKVTLLVHEAYEDVISGDGMPIASFKHNAIDAALRIFEVIYTPCVEEKDVVKENEMWSLLYMARFLDCKYMVRACDDVMCTTLKNKLEEVIKEGDLQMTKSYPLEDEWKSLVACLMHHAHTFNLDATWEMLLKWIETNRLKPNNCNYNNYWHSQDVLKELMKMTRIEKNVSAHAKVQLLLAAL
ncbi:hypothetical protein RI054_12g62640 [Pseudoscourfieldia marina]